MSSKIIRLFGFLALPVVYLLCRPYLLSLAEDWEWATLLAGILLLGLEIFVIPGFGVAGVSAFLLMYVGIVLVMLNNKGTDFSSITANEFSRALMIGGCLLVALIIALFSLLPSILRSKHFQSYTEGSSLNKSQGFVSLLDLPKMVGKQGISETILRPSGKIIVEDKLYDATTLGDFISKGESITVIGQSGALLRVKKDSSI